MSPTNQADTWSNVWAYCTIPTVTEILIVSSTRMAVDLLRRDADGQWPPGPASFEERDTVTLESIGVTLPLAEVYEGTYIARAATPTSFRPPQITAVSPDHPRSSPPPS